MAYIAYNGTVLTVGGSWLTTGDTPTLPPYTMRFQFTDTSYVPVSGTTSKYGTWTPVDTFNGVWDFFYKNSSWLGMFKYRMEAGDVGNGTVKVIDANLQGVTSIAQLFYNDEALTSIDSIDTSTVTNMYLAFYACFNLQHLPDNFDTSNVYNMDNTFDLCTHLVKLPNINTSNVTQMTQAFASLRTITSFPTIDTSKVSVFRETFGTIWNVKEFPTINTNRAYDTRYMFAGCKSLESIPTLTSTAHITDVRGMFAECPKVKRGILDMYTQLSTQANPPTHYSGCFTNCGIDDPEGLAQLQQIPTSWGGTMA